MIVVIASLALLAGLWLQQLLKVDFSTLNGDTHHWVDSKGKWKVVNYFAEWCAPCLREMPELNLFHQMHQDDIDIFAVSFDPLTKEKLISLKQKYVIQFPIIESLNTLPWQQPPNSLPTTYILDADGNLRKQLKGEQSAEKLLQTIELLKAL